MLKIAPEPLGFTLIVVVFGSYPIPSLITITSSIFPSTTTGLNIAPVPTLSLSSTINSGVEKYSFPEPSIWTSIILPFDMIGFNCASLHSLY